MYYSDSVRYAAVRKFSELQVGDTGHDLDGRVDEFINALDSETYQSLIDEVDDREDIEARSTRIKVFLAFLFGVVFTGMIIALR